MITIDPFIGTSRVFDGTMDGKLEVRSNGGVAMLDSLAFPPAPGNTLIEVVNADGVALQEIRAMPGASLDGVPQDFTVLGPSQSCAFVSDGLGNYTGFRKPGRTKFRADTTMYVNADLGVDTNSGVSSAVPFKTMQAALDYLFMNCDMGGYRYALQAADSPTPYRGYSIRGGMTGHYGSPRIVGVLASFTVLGNRSDPSKVVIDGTGIGSAVDVLVGKSLHLDGVTLRSSSGCGVSAVLPGTEVCLHRVNFGACSMGHIYLDRSAGIIIEDDLHFHGDAPFALYANDCATVSDAGSVTMHFHGARAFSQFVVGSARSSSVKIPNIGFVVEPGGVVTGQKWKTLLNGTIDAGQTDLDALIPGSAPGANNYGGRSWWP